MNPHHTPDKNGESPLNQILSLPNFTTEPPPLPAIKEAFEQEVAEQRPIIRDADKAAQQITAFAPDYRAEKFDSIVFSSLKGPILEAQIIATLLIHPVEERTRGIYLEFKDTFSSFVRSIPTYSLMPSPLVPEVIEHKYTPAVLGRVEGGLEYLSVLLEKERILSGDRSYRFEHFIHSSTVDPLKALLSRVGAFDGTSFKSLDRRQQFILLRATNSLDGDDFEITAARQAAHELDRSTKEFVEEYAISLAYLRSSLTTCINSIADAIGAGILSPEHRLLKKVTATLDALDSFENSAFRKNPTPSSIIQDADAAARFFQALTDLKGDVEHSLLQYNSTL